MLIFNLKLFLNFEKCSQKIRSPELELQLMKLGNVLDGGSLNRLHILALSLSFQWLGLHIFIAEGMGLILGWELRCAVQPKL